MKNANEKYKDIIALPHPTSKYHTRMSMVERAAQFSPFAALTGHSDAIKETARLTDKRIVLDESRIAELDYKLQIIADKIDEHPEITITFFKEDGLKDGGIYIDMAGRVREIDKYRKIIVMMNDTNIKFEDIVEIKQSSHEV